MAGESALADGRLITIDILRGLAILWVVLYHIWGVSAVGIGLLPPPRTYYERLWTRVSEGDAIGASTAFTDALFRVGNNGVTVFMILSGVSLTISAMRSPRPLSMRRYYPLRLRRLLVPYWVAWVLFIATLAGVAAYHTQAAGGSFTSNFEELGPIDFASARAGLLLVPRGIEAEHWFAPSPTLWFVLLLVQYYLLFPLLLPVLRRVGPLAFAALALCVSAGSSAWLIWAYGGVAARLYWWNMWFPFRFFEFGIGMAVGYAMVVYPATLRRIFGDARVAAVLLAVAVAMHTAGGWIDAREGYWDAISYDVLVAGLAIAVVALGAARPGRVLQSAPARLVAWIGT
jgi:peptidoglycan/LPS O-acetylase OafA/YrhL